MHLLWDRLGLVSTIPSLSLPSYLLVIIALSAVGLAGCQTGSQVSRDLAPTDSPANPAPILVASPTPIAPAAAPATASPTSQTTGTAVPVVIQLFKFDPSPLVVPVGATVVWTNQDSIIHSVTHGSEERLGSGFDSDFFGEGQSFSLTFDRPGEYAYFCQRHTFMEGMVKVTA